MIYKVLVTKDAESDLNRFIEYLLFEKKNHQAAKNLLDDFEQTLEQLKYVATSLRLCSNHKLKIHGYRRIQFSKHRYFMLYRVQGEFVYVDNIFHHLQDYENKMY